MYWFRFGHTLGALAFGAILIGLVRYSEWWLSRLWSWKHFQWLGRLSYTLYVWHALPYIILLALLGGADASPAVQLARTPILIAAAFAVSIPVYYLVELRVLRMKLRFASEKEVLDLRTGKMVQVDHADEIASADRTLSPDETGDPHGSRVAQVRVTVPSPDPSSDDRVRLVALPESSTANSARAGKSGSSGASR